MVTDNLAVELVQNADTKVDIQKYTIVCIDLYVYICNWYDT